MGYSSSGVITAAGAAGGASWTHRYEPGCAGPALRPASRPRRDSVSTRTPAVTRRASRRRIGLIAGGLLATAFCAIVCAPAIAALAVLAAVALALARGAVLPAAVAVLLAATAGGVWMRRRRTQRAGGASSEPLPIVCTLTSADMRDRGAAWRKVLGSGLVRRSRVPGGIRLSAEPGAEAALLELVERERECCAWIHFEVEGPVVTLTADAGGEAVLAGMFVLARMFVPNR